MGAEKPQSILSLRGTVFELDWDSRTETSAAGVEMAAWARRLDEAEVRADKLEAQLSHDTSTHALLHEDVQVLLLTRLITTGAGRTKPRSFGRLSVRSWFLRQRSSRLLA